jgi:hypothetical protein
MPQLEAAMKAKVDEATGGLFGCSKDIPGFACSVFLPCCAFGEMSSNFLNASMGGNVPEDQINNARNMVSRIKREFTFFLFPYSLLPSHTFSIS